MPLLLSRKEELNGIVAQSGERWLVTSEVVRSKLISSAKNKTGVSVTVAYYVWIVVAGVRLTHP